MSKTRKTPPYGNCKVLDQDGELIFRCEDKKAHWYLDRDLAFVVAEEPLTIQLIFVCNGPGHKGDEFSLQDKDNHCVVCGSEINLTKHHVVPRCYRRYFPDELKEHQWYDVMVLCTDCHESYEEHASDLKQQIAEETGIPVVGMGLSVNKELWAIRKAGITLYRCRKQMPQDRIEMFMKVLREHYGRDEISEQDMLDAFNINHMEGSYIFHGQGVVPKITDFQIFIERWRQHFLHTMEPEHLPDGYNPKRSIWRD